MTQVSDRRVYITGGSSGIGLAAAERMASMGAHVALFSRDRVKLAGAEKSVKAVSISDTQKVFSLSMDVSDPDDVMEKCRFALEKFGVPDILITSAGVPMAGRFEDIGAEDFNSVIQINLYGTRHVIAALLPEMKKKGAGHILLVSSSAGFYGIYGYSAYGASKFALVGLAECLRGELLNHGIRVSVLCPPEVDTSMLEIEKKALPPPTRALKNLAGTLPVNFVAKALVRGIVKNRFIIIPGFRAKIFYWFKRLMPTSVFWYLPDLVARIAERQNE